MEKSTEPMSREKVIAMRNTAIDAFLDYEGQCKRRPHTDTQKLVALWFQNVILAEMLLRGERAPTLDIDADEERIERRLTEGARF